MNGNQVLDAFLVMLRQQALAGQVMNYRQTYKDSVFFVIIAFIRGVPFALQYIKRYLDKAMLGGFVESNDYMYPKFADILVQFTSP